MWSLPGDLTYAARGEPEHVLHQAVSVGVESHKLLLDKLLTTLGAQPRGHATQAATVIRAAIQLTVITYYEENCYDGRSPVLTCTLLIGPAAGTEPGPAY